MPNILLVSSCIHKELAHEQLDYCSSLVKNAGYDYQVELLQAGTYEIPFASERRTSSLLFALNWSWTNTWTKVCSDFAKFSLLPEPKISNLRFRPT